MCNENIKTTLIEVLLRYNSQCAPMLRFAKTPRFIRDQYERSIHEDLAFEEQASLKKLPIPGPKARLARRPNVVPGRLRAVRQDLV